MGSPMPRDLTEEAVAEWLYDLTRDPFSHVPSSTLPAWHWKVSPHPERARAVLALVEAKVREAVALDRENSYAEENRYWEGPASVKNELAVDAIVARVMGREVKRG